MVVMSKVRDGESAQVGTGQRLRMAMLAGLDAAALVNGHPLHRRLCDIRARLVPDGRALWWFRTCETFGADAGHVFAKAWSAFFQCRTAGHTFAIDFFQSGLCWLDPGAEPHWSAEEGIAEMLPDVDFRMWGESVMGEQARQLPDHVTMEGRYGHISEIPLRDADVWLYTSGWDGVPSQLLEVSMTGIPIVGSLVGIAGAFGIRKTMETQLYGVGAMDPVVLSAVGGLLAAVAFLACTVPARRAAKRERPGGSRARPAQIPGSRSEGSRPGSWRPRRPARRSGACLPGAARRARCDSRDAPAMPHLPASSAPA